jgi:hypothetical protein
MKTAYQITNQRDRGMKRIIITLLAIIVFPLTSWCDFIYLNWDPVTTGGPLTGYNIYRKPSGGTVFDKIGSTTMTQYPEILAANGNSYYVTAYGPGGESSGSNIVTYVAPTPTPTPTPKPGVPANLHITMPTPVPTP